MTKHTTETATALINAYMGYNYITSQHDLTLLDLSKDAIGDILQLDPHIFQVLRNKHYPYGDLKYLQKYSRKNPGYYSARLLEFVADKENLKDVIPKVDYLIKSNETNKELYNRVLFTAVFNPKVKPIDIINELYTYAKVGESLIRVF